MSSSEDTPSKEYALTAEELIRVHGERHNTTLPSTGEKSSQPSGDALHSMQIQSRLQDIHVSVSVPRVAQRCHISESYWDSELGVAIVTKQVGKYWDTMGYLDKDWQQLCLRAEEALFLMESNNLEVSFGGVAMSVQQAYEVMLSQGKCTLEEYLTYSHLMRQGYKVVRHQGDLNVTAYEAKVGLDRYTARKRKADDEHQQKSCDLTACLDQAGPSWLGDVAVNKKARLQKEEDQIVCTIIDGILNRVFNTVMGGGTTDSSSSWTPLSSSSSSSSSKDDVQVLTQEDQDDRVSALNMIPNCYKRNRITLTAPSQDLLPPNVDLQHKFYTMDLESLSKSNNRSNSDDDIQIVDEIKQDEMEEEEPSVGPRRNIKLNLLSKPDKTSRGFYSRFDYLGSTKSSRDLPTYKRGAFHGNERWKKWKKCNKSNNKRRFPCNRDNNEPACITLSDDSDVEMVVLSDEETQDDTTRKGCPHNLWTGQTVPLLRPVSATCLTNILSQIDLKFDSTEVCIDQKKTSEYYKISFDIYNPKVHLKKSNPCLPNYRLLVCRPNDPVPTKQDMLATLGTIRDGVPLLYAVCSYREVTFFNLYPVTLQAQINI